MSHDTLNEHERNEGLDHNKIIDLVEKELGTFEASENDGWVLNARNDKFEFHIKNSGTDYNSDLPVMRALYRFPEISEPSLILKAFDEERHLWNKNTYEIIENLDQFKTENSFVQRMVGIKVPAIKQREIVDKRIHFYKSEF